MKSTIKIVLIVVLSCLIASAYGQSDSLKTVKKIPSLNGHSFVSFNQFRTSFIRSNLFANMGFGVTSTLKIPGFVINDQELLTFEGKLFFFDLDVRYQQRFRPWLAMYVSFKMAGRIGSDISTILVDGVNTISGGGIGWLIRIHEWGKFNLSGSIGINNLKGNFINVTKYFEDLINEIPNPQIINSIPATSVGIGIYGAYGINPTIGLQFQSEFIYGESFVRGDSKGFFNGGVVVDIDFNPKYRVPVNIGLGYDLSSEPSVVMESGEVTNSFMARIAYSGAQDFELGAQMNYYDIVIDNLDRKPFVTKIVLSFKFYF